MQISSSRQMSKKSIVDMLVDLGYSKPKADNLYRKYKDWGKLDKLQEYIDAKRSVVSRYDSVPMRDM